MATKKLSVFETLNKINVNEFKEKKGNYDYLSWSDAVQCVLSVSQSRSHSVLVIPSIQTDTLTKHPDSVFMYG